MIFFYLDAVYHNCWYSAHFDFLIYIFVQPGSRCLIVAFKLGASIKYPTLYLHQHPIPVFFFLFNIQNTFNNLKYFQAPKSLSRQYFNQISDFDNSISIPWYENSCSPTKGFIKNISNIDCFRIFVIIVIVCLFVRKLAKLVRCPYSSYPSPTIALSALVSD